MWLDQRANVDERAFAAELAREWSIETGIIEGVYTLDRGITQTLIERGIDSSYIPRESTNRDPELVARIIRAHKDALEGLFAFVASGRDLTTGYIKELHAALLRYQDTTEAWDPFGNRIEVTLEKGSYKRLPNNPTRPDGAMHEYCPPEHVASEMDRLIAFHRHHDERGVPVLVQAAWFHHAFTQIHPFQDGNGRVARALASLLLIKAEFFPLVVRRDDRAKYIDALEAADEGDLGSLAGLFSGLQKRDLTRAIIHAANTKPVTSVDEAVEVTRGLLTDLGKLAPGPRAEVERRAFRLRDLANERLTETGNKLGVAAGTYRFSTELLSPQDGAAKAVLALEAAGVTTKLVVSFETTGRGIVIAGAELQTMHSMPIMLCDGGFQIDYKERTEELEPRFAKWLDDCLIAGLAEWRKTLV